MALVGINNENEFYSNHYLGEVFTSDIRDVLEPWIEQENAARGAERAAREQGKEVEAGYRAPWNQLNSLATEFSANSLIMKNSARSRSVLPINALAGSRY
jgi:hypothetical protein